MPAPIKATIILDSPSDWQPWIAVWKSHAKGQEIWEFINPENDYQVHLQEPNIPTADEAKRLLVAERIAKSAPPTQTVQPESSTQPTQPAPPPPGPSRGPRRRPAARPQDGDDNDDDADPSAPPQEPTEQEVETRLKVEFMRYKQAYRLYVNRRQALADMPANIQGSIHRRHLQHTYECDTAYEMLVELKAKIAPSDFATKLDLRNQYTYLAKPPGRQPLDPWINKWEDVYNKAKKLDLPEISAPNPHFDFLEAIQNVLPHFYTSKFDTMLTQTDTGQYMDFIDLLNQFRNAKRIFQAKQGTLLGGQSAFAVSPQGKELGDEEQEQAAPESSQQGQNSQRTQTAPKCLCGETHWFKKCPYVIPSVRPEDWTPDPEIQAKFESATDKQKSQFRKAAQHVADKQANAQEALIESDQQDAEQSDQESMKASFMATHVSHATSQKPVYALKKSFLLDCGATHHVVNDRDRFLMYIPLDEPENVISGDQTIQIHGYGTAVVYAHTSTGYFEINLLDAAYIPSFHTNLVSYRRMKKGNARWDTDTDTIYLGKQEICQLRDIEDQFVMEYRPLTEDDIQNLKQATQEVIVNTECPSTTKHLPEVPCIQEIAEIPETPEEPPYPQPCEVDETSDVDAEVHEGEIQIPHGQQESLPQQQLPQQQVPQRKQLSVPQEMPKHVPKPGTLSVRAQTHFDYLTNSHNSKFRAAFHAALHTRKEARIHKDPWPPPFGFQVIPLQTVQG